MRNYDVEAKSNEGREYQYNYDKIVREIFLAKVDPFIEKRKDARSLEIGSFDGSMSELILKYVDFLSIVEPSEEMALRVRNRLGKRVEVFVSTIEEFASSGRFDNIFLVHTLEHLDDPVRGLISISNLLTSDGKIFVMVPNANAVSRQIATAMGMLKNPREVMDSEARQGHLRTYDQHSLKTDLEAANLKIIHSGGVVLKALANFQFDIALSDGLISREYMAAADSVGNFYPDLCGSIFSICKL